MLTIPCKVSVEPWFINSAVNDCSALTKPQDVTEVGRYALGTGAGEAE